MATYSDIAVLRTATDPKRFASAIVGQERRYCALAADDPWARQRSIRLNEMSQRTVLIDRRTGTTTPDLRPAATRPPIRETRDIDDWLAIIAAGDGVGITPEGTTAQYRRDGVVFRPLRDAPHPDRAIRSIVEVVTLFEVRGARLGGLPPHRSRPAGVPR